MYGSDSKRDKITFVILKNTQSFKINFNHKKIVFKTLKLDIKLILND